VGHGASVEPATLCTATSGTATSCAYSLLVVHTAPGLITHHFGSKVALRSECDAEVLRRYQALKDDARVAMKASVNAGVVRPSLDEEARLRYLLSRPIGTLLVELLTEGLFTTRQMLDDYLDYVGDPPGEDARADDAAA